MGIEPTTYAWEAQVLPLNYTRFKLYMPYCTAKLCTACSHARDPHEALKARKLYLYSVVAPGSLRAIQAK